MNYTLQQPKEPKKTTISLNHFLNYCATNPGAEIIYRKSEMILHIDIDAAYLIAPQARSRAAGYLYLGNNDAKVFNEAIYILTKIIKAVMVSTA